METQAGHVDWGQINRALDPGQVREMGWQAVAHGADAVLYWQWRPAANGQETYYGTVLGPDGKTNPIQPEIASFATALPGAAAHLSDTHPTAKIRTTYPYD